MSLSIASNAAPVLLEDCLKDFYNYLKSVQSEQLSGDEILPHGPPKDRTNTGNNLHSSSSLHHWGKKDIQSYLRRLRHHGTIIKTFRGRLASEKDNALMLEIISCIHLTLKDNASSTSDVVTRTVIPLLDLVSRLWHSIEIVDLDMLIDLLAKNQVAGETMEGQHVVLFCGAAGSGKTTTLHYLAGTLFEEIEVDGFLHIQPKCVADPVLGTYETSCGRDPVTRTLQTAQIEYHGQQLVLCDTPSLADAEGYEEQIAHGLGIVRALQQAKSVRPVLVISRDGMGVRGRNSPFSETLSSLSRIMCDEEGQVDFQPFQFVFTKYEEKHKPCICRQFQAMWKQPHAEPGKVKMVRSCVGRIIQDTTPEANVVLPMQQNPAELLERLIEQPHPLIEDPSKTFQKLVSMEAVEKLNIQLQISLGDMTQALVRSDYTAALYRLQQMKRLAELLPEAEEYAQKGVSAMLRHATILEEQTAVALRREDFDQAIERLRFLYRFTREVPEAVSSAQAGLELAVRQVTAPRESILQTLEGIRIVCEEKQFRTLLLQLKNDMKGVLKSEQLRMEIRSIQERILGADSKGGGHDAELMNVPCMPQRNGEAFCQDQVASLTDLLLTDMPDFAVDWLNMDSLVSNRSAFLQALGRLKQVSLTLKDSPGGDMAAQVCEQAYAKFYGVVDQVLSREDQGCRSAEELKIFEHQAWFLTLLKEASEVHENSPEGAKSCLLYHQAFNKFYGVVENVLANAEKNFLASSNDLEAFERQARFLALLRNMSEVLQNSPGNARASAVYEQAFTLFYAVVASVLAEAEKSFQVKDRDLMVLERQARFLALLKNVSAILQNSPGSQRASTAYKHAFRQFYVLIGNMLAEVEQEYLSDVQDWDALENICWFLALLMQGKLKYKPDMGSEEEKQMKGLEQRLLTLMLRTELEVTDTMKLIRAKKILTFVKRTSNNKEEMMTEIQFLNLTELNARRKLLVCIVDKTKVRKLLPSKIEPNEIIDALSHLDKQLAKFFGGQVLNAVQEYNMVVELQKTGKKLLVTKLIAQALRNNIVAAKEDFATVRSWSKEIAAKTEANWRRLGALKKCVDLGISKLEKMIAKEQGGFDFTCGAFGSSSQGFCQP